MRPSAPLISLCASLAWLASLAGPGVFGQQGNKAVLVELFTSEGCSSCPPADLFLSELNRRSATNGVKLITVGEHVDYWNHLGWTDPYSSPDFTERQKLYAQDLNQQSTYTPEMVIDGSYGFVGSDRQQAQRIIERAAQEPKASVKVTANIVSPSQLKVSLAVESVPNELFQHTTNVFVALTENNLLSRVTSGENSGHDLRQDCVARTLKEIPAITLSACAHDCCSFTLSPSWKRNNVRVVAFLKDSLSKKIVAVDQTSLP